MWDIDVVVEFNDLLLFSLLVCFCGRTVSVEMADVAGLTEAAGARFSSLELIGRGSFGDVYKA